MRKLTVLLSVVLLCAAYAGTTPFLSVGGTNDAQTAHWQAYNDGSDDVAACIVDGETTYGLGDKTWLYNSDGIDLSDADSAYLTFSYTLATADSNDYFAVYAVNYEPVSGDFDPDAETPLAVYDTNVDSWTGENLDLGDVLGEDDVYVVFYWVSDATGVDDGVRVNDAGVYSWDGETFAWTQVLYWNTSHSPWGPGEQVNVDLSDGAGGALAVDFHYDDAGWDWYAEVDQVVVSDDSRASLLSEQFESSFPPSGWTIVDYQDYSWVRNDTVYRPNYAGGSGYCADADSDWYYTGINSHLISPLVDCSGSTTVDLDFYASYTDIGGGDYFEVLLGLPEESTDIETAFDDLSGWTAVDDGEYLNIEYTTWGSIKATF